MLLLYEVSHAMAEAEDSWLMVAGTKTFFGGKIINCQRTKCCTGAFACSSVSATKHHSHATAQQKCNKQKCTVRYQRVGNEVRKWDKQDSVERVCCLNKKYLHLMEKSTWIDAPSDLHQVVHQLQIDMRHGAQDGQQMSEKHKIGEQWKNCFTNQWLWSLTVTQRALEHFLLICVAGCKVA